MKNKMGTTESKTSISETRCPKTKRAHNWWEVPYYDNGKFMVEFVCHSCNSRMMYEDHVLIGAWLTDETTMQSWKGWKQEQGGLKNERK